MVIMMQINLKTLRHMIENSLCCTDLSPCFVAKYWAIQIIERTYKNVYDVLAR